jgi:hypothetical protein
MSLDKINIFMKRFNEIGDSVLLDAKYMGMSVNDVLTAYDIMGLTPPLMIRKNSLNRFYGVEKGWGNGYVKIVPKHIYYGKGYDDIPLNVHGGLTFSEIISDNDVDGWPEGHWIGFDTAHYGDDILKWPKEKVLEETKDLFRQVYSLK